MIDNWTTRLPFLHQEWKEQNIHRYDAYGFSRELTEEQKLQLKVLEAKNPHLRIVGVLDAKYLFPGDEVMHFNTYLCLANGSNPEPCENDKDLVYFLAYVDNLSDPDCSEFGYVGVKEITGLLKRVY
jgi:hypothetical protein